jgi:hypothetical protein
MNTINILVSDLFQLGLQTLIEDDTFGGFTICFLCAVNITSDCGCVDMNPLFDDVQMEVGVDSDL